MSIEVDNAGPTGVSMIEPDHLNPTLHKPSNQHIRAKNSLSRRPHHHQNSRKPRIPDLVCPYPQRPGVYKLLLRIQHGGTVSTTCCRPPTFTDGLATVASAVSGNAKVGNRGGLLGRWQHIEYVIGFNLDRRLFDLAECMPTVPVPSADSGVRRWNGSADSVT